MPDGDEPVQITPRVRGAPLDLIVAEAMILANSHLGRLARRARRAGDLPQPGQPGAGREGAHGHQAGAARRHGRRRSTAWATSPLRRYVDLVNQWQIVACARHGRTAALAAPFKPKDATLFSIISAFDAAYAAYNDFQHAIERYWTLRWIWRSSGVRELDATVMKDGLVRADTLPLVFRAVGLREPAARHARARARSTAPTC